MKTQKWIAILGAMMMVSSSAWAEKSSAPAPVVGGAVMAVNVDVVATTGYRASKLLGSDIYNDKGDKIGSLDDFIVGSDANVSVAVISVGGFLGMGDRKVAVPASLFTSNEKGQTVLPNATADQLKALPEFIYSK
jgi:sporulation protein YlmC with PRC-barrel domain